jgi:acetyl esterase/lipase
MMLSEKVPLLLAAFFSVSLAAELPIKAVPYRGQADQADPLVRERCLLDITCPTSRSGWPTLVWLHGGGLTGGWRGAPEQLVEKGVGVVAVGYRLSPSVPCPAYIDDAAAATAWVLDHIADYGGDPRRVFVGGVSAGGYLAAMVGVDPTWLKLYGHATTDLAGLIPISAQVTTHFTIRREHGQSEAVPVIDAFAPAAFVDKPMPPLLLVCGDRNLDMPGRTNENRWFVDMLRDAGNQNVLFYELEGFSHGSIYDGALPLVRSFVLTHMRGDGQEVRRHAVASFSGSPVLPLPLGDRSNWLGSSAAWNGVSDLDAALSLSWSHAGLVIDVLVTDDVFMPAASVSDAAQYDSVQISLQAQNFVETVRMTSLTLAMVGGHPELFCTGSQRDPRDKGESGLPRTFKPVVGADIAIVGEGKNMRYRVNIPPSWLGKTEWNAGDAVSMSLLVNDRDAGDYEGGLRWGVRRPGQLNLVVLGR